MLSHGWFGLIGFSTVLTYQHHLVDIAGGVALALLCYYVIPPRTRRSPEPVTTNPRVGVAYAAAAVLLAGSAHGSGRGACRSSGPRSRWRSRRAGTSGCTPASRAREDGRLPLAARIILAPWLAGQHLSLIYYRRHCRPWNEVVPNVWIGRRLNDREAASAVRQGVTAVLDLTGECSEACRFSRWSISTSRSSI